MAGITVGGGFSALYDTKLRRAGGSCVKSIRFIAMRLIWLMPRAVFKYEHLENPDVTLWRSKDMAGVNMPTGVGLLVVKWQVGYFWAMCWG